LLIVGAGAVLVVTGAAIGRYTLQDVHCLL